MKKFSLGIIGYGGFGQFLHNSWKENKKIDIVAVSDLAYNNNTVKNLNFYPDWRQLVADPDIDIVAIATPPDTHPEIAIEAIENQKHVILEKPLAINLADAKKIETAQANSGSILVVDFMLRFHPFILQLKKWTQSQMFGRFRRVGVENYAQDDCLPIDHWFWDKSQSGGILIEHGVHFIDLVNFISDSPAIKIKGLGNSRNQFQEDQVMACILHRNGLIATHYHDFSRPGFFETTSIRLVYDLAQIDLFGWIPLKGEFSILINSNFITELEKLPGLKITQNIPIEKAVDNSRPSGWGQTDGENNPPSTRLVSGGRHYQVNRHIKGTFNLTTTKQKVYSDLLNNVLDDVVCSIDDPNHKPFITIDEAIMSLKIALAAADATSENDL
ncbi:MAG: Gfo/Idh/MocA family oxidoreductase [Candidatus Marinimicrobia bacterium]|nr:Gfo/Idh/MocA family oxidoreductase [Candidatus Neomarinimicrobiota bacterium]